MKHSYIQTKATTEPFSYERASCILSPHVVDHEFGSIYYLFYVSMFKVKLVSLAIFNIWLVVATFGQKSLLNIFLSVLTALGVVFMDLRIT